MFIVLVPPLSEFHIVREALVSHVVPVAVGHLGTGDGEQKYPHRVQDKP